MFTGDGSKYNISFLSTEFSIRLGIWLVCIFNEICVSKIHFMMETLLKSRPCKAVDLRCTMNHPRYYVIMFQLRAVIIGVIPTYSVFDR